MSTSPDLPLMLSLEALLTQDTAEAKHSLFEALNVSRHPITLLRSAVKTNWNALVITRDGKAAITGGEGGQVAFWDIAGASAESPVVQSAHSGPVHDLALSNDGKLLASVGEDGVIRLWDVTARRPLEDQSIPKQPAPVTAVAFGPRDLLAFGTTVGDEPKIAITLWDLAARQPKATWNATSDGPVSNIKFSRDGSMLASVAVGGDTILWDVATGNQIHSDFLKDTDSLAFSPDGQWLASGSWQLTLRKVSDFAAVQFQLPDAPTHIDAVEFSPDGQLLASAAYSGNVMVWNAATRSPVEGPIQLNVGPIGSMAFGPGGNTLFATGREGEIAVIALGSAPLIRVLPTGTYIAGLAFSPSRGVLASNGDRGSVTLWDPLTLSRVAQTTPLHPELVHAVAFSRDGKVLASGSIKGQLAFWDPQTARQVAQPAKVASVAIERLSFSPDGSMLAIVPAGREVLLWDYRNHQSHPQILQADPKFVLDAVFTPDGARLVTAGDSGEIIEWDWRTGQRIGSPIKIGAGVDALAFSPDGKLLSAGDYDGHVTLWDLAHRKRIGEPLIGHTNFVRAVAFSPDSKSLASGGDDGAAILWDLASHQAIARFRHGATVLSGDQTARTPLAVNHVAFSSDGKMLAADGPENRILLWDVDIHSWELQACRQTNRNLTEEEWKRYVGEDVSYRETCPQGMPRMDGTRKRFWIW
jgi:WD40 repeat protein